RAAAPARVPLADARGRVQRRKLDSRRDHTRAHRRGDATPCRRERLRDLAVARRRARPLRERERERLAHRTRRAPQLRRRGGHRTQRSMTARSHEADRLWAALGDPMRIRLLDLLLERGEATASTLASALPITRQGVSKHLAILERDGLVTSHRTGREVRYAVRAGGLGQARAGLAQIAARRDRRLLASQKMAEGASRS